ncbi:hypothetical protein GCM10023149_49040 [Mucilaginibacter gynuensis]|uniref:DNA-packaging protein gp3 n=1 Tax=Mucilaginibacter gynuensis TaxID=1302236 RepID=A0ABP8HFV8_9SPHI
MNKPTSAIALQRRIEAYFKYIEGEYHLENLPAKSSKTTAEFSAQKVWNRESEPATLCGLILHLGFNSRREFEEQEANGPHAAALQRARLRIEAEYEKKLHYQSATGAIFALKSIGWNDRSGEASLLIDAIKNIEVNIITSGPPPATNERDIAIELL